MKTADCPCVLGGSSQLAGSLWRIRLGSLGYYRPVCAVFFVVVLIPNGEMNTDFSQQLRSRKKEGQVQGRRMSFTTGLTFEIWLSENGQHCKWQGLPIFIVITSQEDCSFCLFISPNSYLALPGCRGKHSDYYSIILPYTALQYCVTLY